MNIKTIVVPVDGSKHADRAVEMAADLAARYGAGLKFVHALIQGKVPDELRKLLSKPVPEEPGLAVGAAYVEPSLPAAALEEIANKLLERAEATAKEAGVKDIERTLAGGSAAEAILETARTQNADLIVMGSRGLGTLKGMLVGSVSHKVQQLADCSVITVR